ncbi:MAG: ankyrin repeat domain-containing protein [Bacteriovoracia bacterium]
MGKNISKLLILLTILMPFGAVAALADHAKIEAIGGAASVSVKRDGKTVELKKGEFLQSGDELFTNDHTAADIRFDDQTLVRVGVNSTYKIVEDTGATKFLHRLFSGVVRVLVPVKKEAKTDEIKFKMKTPQGTIGVRGTEFTVAIGEQGTTLKGLSGEVMFGPENAEFSDTSKFVYVGRGMESSVAANKAPAKPKKYDLEKYLKEIDKGDGIFGGVAKRSNLNMLRRGESAPVVVAANTAPVKEAAKPIKAGGASKAEVKAPAKKSLDEQLMDQVMMGNLPKVQNLVKNGANVNYQDEDGNSSLHFAVLKEHQEIIQFLIIKGAKVNIQTKMGTTPLMQVAIDNAPKIIADLLVQNDADPKIKNKDGFTALDIAESKTGNARDEALIAFLRKVTK